MPTRTEYPVDSIELDPEATLRLAALFDAARTLRRQLADVGHPGHLRTTLCDTDATVVLFVAAEPAAIYRNVCNLRHRIDMIALHDDDTMTVGTYRCTVGEQEVAIVATRRKQPAGQGCTELAEAA